MTTTVDFNTVAAITRHFKKPKRNKPKNVLTLTEILEHLAECEGIEYNPIDMGKTLSKLDIAWGQKMIRMPYQPSATQFKGYHLKIIKPA